MSEKSLYLRLEDAAGLDGRAPAADLVVADLLSAQRMPELKLPERHPPVLIPWKRHVTVFAVLTSCAAAVAVFLRPPEFRTKGAETPELVAQREGQVFPVQGDETLVNGDVVRVRLMAEGMASWALFKGNGDRLVPFSRPVALPGAEQGVLPGAARLLAPAEAETLVVAVCRERAALGRVQRAPLDVSVPEGEFVRRDAADGCTLWLRRLR